MSNSGRPVALAMAIVLGMHGSQWAWQNKRWDSVEHFLEVQGKWARWSVIVLVAIVLALLELV